MALKQLIYSHMGKSCGKEFTKLYNEWVAEEVIVSDEDPTWRFGNVRKRNQKVNANTSQVSTVKNCDTVHA